MLQFSAVGYLLVEQVFQLHDAWLQTVAARMMLVVTARLALLSGVLAGALARRAQPHIRVSQVEDERACLPVVDFQSFELITLLCVRLVQEVPLIKHLHKLKLK